LIDVGWPGTLPKLVANLRRKDIALTDIDYLLITQITLAWPKQPKQIAGLQAQIKAGLAQVVLVTQQIQDLMHQNEELQGEVTSLKNQLTQRLTAQTV